MTLTPETPESVQIPVYMYWNDMPDNFTLDASDVTDRWTYVISVDSIKSVAQENFDTGSVISQNLLENARGAI
jgi:hypothetical protein